MELSNDESDFVLKPIKHWLNNVGWLKMLQDG